MLVSAWNVLLASPMITSIAAVDAAAVTRRGHAHPSDHRPETSNTPHINHIIPFESLLNYFAFLTIVHTRFSRWT